MTAETPARPAPPRAALPDRRNAVTHDATWTSDGFGEREMAVSVGFYPPPVGRQGPPPAGEVFVEQVKALKGSALDGVLCESGILVSLLLQSGWTLPAIAARLAPQEDGRSVSPIGAVVRIARAIEAGAPVTTAGPDVRERKGAARGGMAPGRGPQAKPEAHGGAGVKATQPSEKGDPT